MSTQWARGCTTTARFSGAPLWLLARQIQSGEAAGGLARRNAVSQLLALIVIELSGFAAAAVCGGPHHRSVGFAFFSVLPACAGEIETS